MKATSQLDRHRGASGAGVGDLGRLRGISELEPVHRGSEWSRRGCRQLTLRMQPVGGSAVTLRPTIVEVIEGHRLRWLGRLGIRRLFDAEHLFIVEPRGASGTRLVQQEEFSGLLVRLFQRSLDRGTLPAFHAMNMALKDRAERAIVARG